MPLLQLYVGGAHLTLPFLDKTITLVPDLDLAGTTTAVWLTHAGFAMPFAIFLLHNYIAGLPKDLFEAARIDGADHFTIFYKLVLPLSVPVLAAFAIFQFLWTWNDYLIANTMIGNNPDNAPTTVRIANLAGDFGRNEFVLPSAAFVQAFVPIVVFFAPAAVLRARHPGRLGQGLSGAGDGVARAAPSRDGSAASRRSVRSATGSGATRPTTGRSPSALLEAALDAGMNLVDTADVYGLDWGGTAFGQVEELLGHVLADAPGLRDRMVLATKGGIRPPVPYDSSPAALRVACEASLRRLQVDVIDLYQIHRPDMFTHPADVAATLAALARGGQDPRGRRVQPHAGAGRRAAGPPAVPARQQPARVLGRAPRPAARRHARRLHARRDHADRLEPAGRRPPGHGRGRAAGAAGRARRHRRARGHRPRRRWRWRSCWPTRRHRSPSSARSDPSASPRRRAALGVTLDRADVYAIVQARPRACRCPEPASPESARQREPGASEARVGGLVADGGLERGPARPAARPAPRAAGSATMLCTSSGSARGRTAPTRPGRPGRGRRAGRAGRCSSRSACGCACARRSGPGSRGHRRGASSSGSTSTSASPPGVAPASSGANERPCTWSGTSMPASSRIVGAEVHVDDDVVARPSRGAVRPGAWTSSGIVSDGSSISRLSNQPWSPRKKPWSDV